MLHSPFSIHFCFPLETMKPCFVWERVNRADPLTEHFSSSSRILNFWAWATIIIQIFYILSQKSGQQTTVFKSFSKHFCVQYFNVRNTAKNLSESSFPPLHAISCRWLVFRVVCLLGLKVFVGQNENLCREKSKKVPVLQLYISQLALYLEQSKTYCFKSRLFWKGRVERFISKEKIIVQSR